MTNTFMDHLLISNNLNNITSMNLKIHFIVGLIFLVTGCTTTEKFTVYAPVGTMLYTPDKTYAPSATLSSKDKAEIIVPSDMYCGYILAKTPDSELKIPIGVDYSKKKHIGTKVAFYTGASIASIGVGAAASCCLGGLLASANGDDYEPLFGAAMIGASVSGIGVAIGAPAQSRLNQTAYDYNFGYDNQRLKIPYLSKELINPNSPKGLDNMASKKNDNNSSRRKASSGKDVVAQDVDSKSHSTNTPNVNKSRLDNAKKIEGSYIGNGKLFFNKKVDETYSKIDVIIERIGKDKVSIRIVESDDDYFDAPLIFNIKKNNNGGYNLYIDGLPEATILITKAGKLTFNHKKVNIDNHIYTLEIIAEKE